VSSLTSQPQHHVPGTSHVVVTDPAHYQALVAENAMKNSQPQQTERPNKRMSKHSSKQEIANEQFGSRATRDEDSEFDDDEEWEYDPTGGSPTHSSASADT